MATKTAGTPATTSLTAVQYSPAPSTLSDADLATIAQGIYKDGGYGAPDGVDDGAGNAIARIVPGAFIRAGLLWLPGRSKRAVAIYPGDWVAVDGYGNAFPIPQRALPGTLTASVTLTNASNTVSSATNILTYGWQVGTHITSSHTPAGTVIGSIAGGGLSFTMVAVATGAAANATGSATETMTAGTWTHS